MNSKNKARRLCVSLLTLLLILAAPVVALATDISVTASSTAVKAGDRITVTVIVSAKNIAVAEGAFTYDPALLKFTGSSGGASDGYINMTSAQKGGSSSLTAVLKFTAAGKGTAVVDVSMTSVLNYSGEKLENANSSVSITVESSGAPAESASPDTSPALPDLSQTGVPAVNVQGASAPMYVWRSLKSLTMPSGFVDRQVIYAGEYVGGTAIPDSEDITLLYLSEKTGENAGYYIYDEKKNELFPYLTVTSVSASFTFIWPGESVTVPEGYEQTALNLNGKDIPAWAAKDSDGSFYLVYVRNSAGERGLYLYNTKDESVQRFTVPPENKPTAPPAASPAESAQPANAGSSEIAIAPALVFALIAGCAAFAAAAALFGVLYFAKRAGNKVPAEKTAGVKEPAEKKAEDKNPGAKASKKDAVKKPEDTVTGKKPSEYTGAEKTGEKRSEKKKAPKRSPRKKSSYAFHSGKDGTPPNKDMGA